MPSLQKSPPAKKHRYRWAKLTGMVIILLVAAFFLTQFAGRLYLQKWLLKNGADTAIIQAIRVNPFTGTVAVRGVDIEKEGETVLGNSTIYLNLGLKNLFSHEALLQEVRLVDLQIDIEQYRDGSLRIGSYTIDPSSEGDGSAAREPEEVPVPWIFSTDKVTMDNLNLHYTGPDLEILLKIEKGRLENFTTDATETGGSLVLEGTLNNAPIELKLSRLRITPDLQLDGHLALKNFALSQLAATLQKVLPTLSGTIDLGGDIAFSYKKHGAMTASYRGKLGLNTLQLGQGKWQLANTTSWNGAVAFSMDQYKIRVDTEGELHLEATEFGMEQAPEQTQASIGSLDWSGKAGWFQEKEGQLLTTSGKLSTRDLAGRLTGAGVEFSNRKLETILNFALPISNLDEFGGSFELSLAGTSLKLNGESLLELGTLTLSGLEAEPNHGLQLDRFALQDVRIPGSTTIPAPIRIDTVQLDHAAIPDLHGASPITAGRLTIAGTEVTDRAGTTMLASVKELAGEEIVVTSPLDPPTMRVTTGTVSGSGIVVMEQRTPQTETTSKTAPMARLGNLRVADISYDQADGLVIDTVNLAGLTSSYRREKAAPGTTAENAQQTKTVAQAAQEKQASQPEKLEGIPVRIGRITVEGDSGLRFTDNSLSKPFTLDLDLKMFEARGVDLNQREEPFDYSLEATINKYAPLVVTGKMAPLARYVSLSQKTRLKNFSMQDASPYTIDAIGTYFPSGRLDYSSSLELHEGRIDMKNNLVLKELEAKKIDGALAEKLDNQLPVPLDLALSMLRDSDGTIDLDIPLEGELSSMNVGLADILMTTLSKAITVAVAPYLAYTALGPTGALIFVGAKLGQALIDTELPSLEYEPGVVELTEEQKTVLADIGKSIEPARPKAEQPRSRGKQPESENSPPQQDTYSICARVNMDEIPNTEGQPREETMKALFGLGEQRANLVKSYLVQELGFDERRFLICNPTLNFEKGAKPVVEFKK